MAAPGEGNPLVERMKGTAKRLAGAATGNDDLVREGEAHDDKAQALTDARRLEEEAAKEEREADLAAREQTIIEERERLELAEAEDRARADIEAKQAREQAKAETEAARKQQAAERQAAAVQAAAARSTTAAARERNDETMKAAALDAAADDARGEANRLDDRAHDLEEQ